MTCTITLVQSKVTFTMESSSCPDIVNDNSGACYVIKHITDGDDKTVKVGNTTYTNCKITSQTIKRTSKYSITNPCNTEFTDISSFIWASTAAEPRWRGCQITPGQTTCYNVSCLVTLECNLS